MSVLQGFQNAKTEDMIDTRRQMSEMKKSYFYEAWRIQVARAGCCRNYMKEEGMQAWKDW